MVWGVESLARVEDAIAAESLNKVHAMKGTITSNLSLRLSYEQIEQLAYRLLDWGDLRIYRSEPGGPVLAYRAQQGRPGRRDPDPGLATLRGEVLASGEPDIIEATRPT